MVKWLEAFRDAETARWQALMSFVNAWLEPIEPNDGIAPERLDAAEERLGVELPVALRELHMLAGARDDLFRQQNVLLAPEDIEIEGEHLLVWRENQYVVHWGIPLSHVGDEDPKVELLDEVVTPAGDSFSKFAFQMLLMDLFAVSNHGVIAHLGGDGHDVETLFGHVVEPVDLPIWHWPAYPSRIYASDDLVLVVHGNDDLYASARDGHTHDRTVALLEGRGLRIDVEWTE